MAVLGRSRSGAPPDQILDPPLGCVCPIHGIIKLVYAVIPCRKRWCEWNCHHRLRTKRNLFSRMTLIYAHQILDHCMIFFLTASFSCLHTSYWACL